MTATSPPEVWTILSLLRWTTDYFSQKGIDSPRLDAEVLLSHSLGLSRVGLYTRFEKPLLAEELAQFKKLIKRRINREPVAYITQKREFWSLDFFVDSRVLVPRPETECLVEAALEVLDSQDKEPQKVLDVGVGSGAVILSLAKEKPAHRYYGTDASSDALAVARKNAKDLEIQTRGWALGLGLDLVSSQAGLDLVVSNPPYVPAGDLDGLEPELRFEPTGALDGGPEGMDVLNHLIQHAPRVLCPGGTLLLEMGWDQGDLVRQAAAKTGAYQEVEIRPDYAGLDRVARLRLK